MAEVEKDPPFVVDPLDKLQEIVDWGATTGSDRDLHIQWIQEAIGILRQEQKSYSDKFILLLKNKQLYLDAFEGMRIKVQSIAEKMKRTVKQREDAFYEIYPEYDRKETLRPAWMNEYEQFAKELMEICDGPT